MSAVPKFPTCAPQLDYAKLRLMKPPQGTLNIDDVKYPSYGSIKYDGFRAAVLKGRTWLNSLREIDNLYTRNMLIEHSRVLDKHDGELTVGDLTDPECFSNCQSAFTARAGEPDFTFWAFDRVAEGTFEERWLDRPKIVLPFMKIVECVLLNNRQELDAYVEQVLEDGHEGVILRRAGSLYKFGRATFKTQEVLRIKPMETDEAKVIGFECEYENTNPKVVNAQGKAKRSLSREGMVAKDTLGKLVCQHKTFGKILVSGFTKDMADEIWRNQKRYLGRITTFSYQKHGTTEKPRILKYKGFRDVKDIS